MNRLKTRAAEKAAPAFARPQPLDPSLGRFAVDEAELPHAVFAPMHYEPNYAYPVIVWLHGPRDSELQLKRIMPLVSLRNYVAVAPRGIPSLDAAGDDPRFGWCDSEPAAERAERNVFDCLDQIADKIRIHSRRVFLAGYDCGGTAALRIGLSNPQRFAGVLSLGGPLPEGRAPLARLHEVRSLPVFVACGKDSQRYPADRVCRDLKLYHLAGVQVSLRQYPCGDEMTSHMLKDVDRWIMEQIASGAC